MFLDPTKRENELLALRKDVTAMRKDLPVVAEYQFRNNMCAAILTEYAEYAYLDGKFLPKLKEEIFQMAQDLVKTNYVSNTFPSVVMSMVNSTFAKHKTYQNKVTARFFKADTSNEAATKFADPNLRVGIEELKTTSKDPSPTDTMKLLSELYYNEAKENITTILKLPYEFSSKL